MDANIPRPLLTAPQLYAWLRVTENWLNDRLEKDPDFPFSDIANPGASRRNLRFDVEAVANHLGLPVPSREATEGPETQIAA